METKTLKLTDELLNLKAEMFYWADEKGRWINKLIHKKAVKAGINYEKAHQKFWTEAQKLYPEMKNKKFQINRYEDVFLESLQ